MAPLARAEDLETALSIDIPSDDRLRVEDRRRLTGPGFLWDRTGAVLQVSSRGIAPDRVAALWRREARRVLDAVGWEDEEITERGYEGGHNLALSAPVDQLYSAIFVAETAWHFCAAELLDRTPGDFDAMVADLRDVMAREANPDLLRLFEGGAARGIEVLCDDDEVSIGHGARSATWPVDALPPPGDLDWQAYGNVPIALITGTNGKTTTTRLCAAIAREAGRVSGLTSTDFVRVGGEVLDRGDYSGPGGARLLLRDKRLEMAFLEVARGGILRRGLATRSARAAVVTNVAADHLGQYGIMTVEELARVKFAVHRALTADGVMILNADDRYVVNEAEHTPGTHWWFSMDANAPQIEKARAEGVPCAWCDGTAIIFFDGLVAQDIVAVNDIPITMSGAARHNTRNALAATCASIALGLSPSEIAAGLSAFQSDPKDNPGRFNAFEVNGAQVFVDFAHNPHSIAAVAETVAGIGARRRFVMLSLGGDRSDETIRTVTETALTLKPDVVVPAELADYLRGRQPGEVPDLIERTCRAHGLTDDQVIRAVSPADGAEKIVAMLEPGDVALLLTLSERDRVFEILQR